MKKLFYAFGIVAFLALGSYAVESVIASSSNTETSVYDDPPAKKSKSTKHSCCSDYGKKDDCSSNCSHSKGDCDTKGKSSKKASTKTTDNSKKTTPDKK